MGRHAEVGLEHSREAAQHKAEASEAKGRGDSRAEVLHQAAASAHSRAAELYARADTAQYPHTARGFAQHDRAVEAGDKAKSVSAKAREHEQHAPETGAKGGQFYTTATGAKVYINK